MVLLVAALLIFLQAFRVPVNIIGPGLDRSYPHVLNLFAFTATRFGTDLIYTYGPLGFLLHIENVRDNLATGFVFWTALYLLFTLSITYFVSRLTSGPRRFFALLLTVLVAGYIDEERLITCLVMVLLLISFDHERHRAGILAACCALASIALLIKFPIGVACAGMVIAGALWPISSRSIIKNLLVVALSLSASVCLLWFITSGSLHGIIAYCYNSLQLIRGYTSVMSFTRVHENNSLLALLAALTALVAMILLLPKARRLHTLLVVLFPLFVCWKSGIVRFDGHVLALVTMAMCSGLLLCILHLSRETTAASAPHGTRASRGSYVAHPVFALVLFVVSCGALNRGLAEMEFKPDRRYPLVSRAFLESIGGVANSWVPGLIPLANALDFQEYKTQLDALAAADLTAARLDDDLLNTIGRKSIDIYSYELGFLAANPGLNYRPKPIFQHFNAFTQHLDQLNATFFASPARPELLLMHHPKALMEGVDGRHPLFDDPIAFLEIMNAYETVFVESKPSKPQVALLRLRTATAPRFGPPITIKEETVGWNENIRLPAVDASSVLRARVEIGKAPLSILKEAVFRLGPMYLTYVLADGTTRRYRLMPPHLSSGVWISPLFEDYQNLYAFMGGKSWFGPKVIAIRFEADNPKSYTAHFKLVWERIDCASHACGSVEGRVLSHAVRTMPVPIDSTLLARITSPAGSLSAIDVRFSTYAKVNEGTVTLQVLDSQGGLLRECTADAASLMDNEYKLFTFAPLNGIEGQQIAVRLTYAPEMRGMLAAWKTSPTATDFDFRVYGH